MIATAEITTDRTDANDCGVAFLELWPRVFTKEEQAESCGNSALMSPTSAVATGATVVASVSDDEILSKMFAAKNGAKIRSLWAGDLSENGNDHSSADQALANHIAYYVGNDVDRVISIFSQSALGKRDKWTDRADYREGTTRKAIESCKKFFQWFKAKERKKTPAERAAATKAKIEALGLDDNGLNEVDPLGLRFEHNRTENAMARAFAQELVGKIRWGEHVQKFFIWDGVRWARDESRTVESLAREFCRRLFDRAATAGGLLDENDVGSVSHLVHSLNKANGVKSLLWLARSEPGISTKHTDFDSHPWLLNTLTCVIDLQNDRILPHDPALMLTQLAPVKYDPDAKRDRWDKFFDEITNKDIGLQQFLKRFAGSCITGVIRDNILPFFYGKGANGKSVYLNALIEVLGGDYAMRAAPDLLMSRGRQPHPTERADLANKRFVATNEINDGSRLDEALIKDLTGGDRIRARFMRCDFFEYEPTHKILMAGNHRPIVRGDDHGIWRRLKLVPFTQIFEGKRKNGKLKEELRDEYSSVLNWLIEGCREWREHGLGEVKTITDATKDYRKEQDTIGDFLRDRCTSHSSSKATVLLRATATELYTSYVNWCLCMNERPANRTRFGNTLTERGIVKSKSSVVVYTGIRLKSPEEIEASVDSGFTDSDDDEQIT